MSSDWTIKTEDESFVANLDLLVRDIKTYFQGDRIKARYSNKLNERAQLDGHINALWRYEIIVNQARNRPWCESLQRLARDNLPVFGTMYGDFLRISMPCVYKNTRMLLDKAKKDFWRIMEKCAKVEKAAVEGSKAREAREVYNVYRNYNKLLEGWERELRRLGAVEPVVEEVAPRRRVEAEELGLGLSDGGSAARQQRPERQHRPRRSSKAPPGWI